MSGTQHKTIDTDEVCQLTHIELLHGKHCSRKHAQLHSLTLT